MLLWVKIEADILQTAIKWNWKWIFIHQGYFFQKDSSCKCCTKARALSRQGWSWAKYKDVSIKILKRHVTTPCNAMPCKLKLAKLKDLRLNSSEKLATE